RIRGGLIGPLERYVKVNDVFAVSQLQRTNRPAPPEARTATGKVIRDPQRAAPAEGFTAVPRDFTLLRVIEAPKEGAVRCKVLTRYQAALPVSPKVAGYRCMKLATVAAPVAVRLVGGDGRAHEKASVVNVRASGDFDAKADARDNLDFRDGLFRSSHPLP